MLKSNKERVEIELEAEKYNYKDLKGKIKEIQVQKGDLEQQVKDLHTENEENILNYENQQNDQLNEIAEKFQESGEYYEYQVREKLNLI